GTDPAGAIGRSAGDRFVENPAHPALPCASRGRTGAGIQITLVRLQRDRLVDKHDRQLVANRVKKSAVLPHQSTLYFLRDRLPSAITDLAFLDSSIQGRD